MDWIRRNWPDLLIAIALVAVIAGIIATLLSGGSLWPTSGSGGNQQLSQGRSVVNGNGGTAPTINLRGTNNNASGNATGLSVGGAPTGSTLNRNNVEVVSPGLNGASGVNLSTGQSLNANTGATLAAPLGVANSGVNNTGTGVGNSGVSLAAPLTSNSASSPRAGTSISADINNAANRSLSVANNAAGNVAAAAGGVVSATGVTIPTNANSAGSQQLAGRATFASPQAINVNPASGATAGGSYKVSVGAFGVATNAQNLANNLAQQGYPVGFDQQGRLNVVYVGPFNSQAEADAVAGQLRQGGQSTSVYADPQARAANAASNTQQNFQQQQSVAQSTVTTQNTAANLAPAGAGRSYLQVGAYNDVASSLTQRSTLERLGLTVYDRREGGYVKLIVGPFAANEVGIYRSQLRDRGIDSFPVN